MIVLTFLVSLLTISVSMHDEIFMKNQVGNSTESSHNGVGEIEKGFWR